MALRRHVLWNLLGTGLPLLAAALAFPVLNARLGAERFGLVTLLWTLVGYLSLFDFGLGRALTQLLARNRGAGTRTQDNAILGTGLAFTLGAGLAGGLLLLLLAGPLTARWLTISLPLQAEARTAFQLTGFAIPMATVSAAVRGALEGAEQFFMVNTAKVFLGASSFLLPVLVVLVKGPSLAGVAAALVLSRALTLALFGLALARAYPAFRWGLRTRLSQAKALASFGLWMTLSNLISPVLVNADRFLIASFLGAGLVAFYTVPFELMVRLQVVPGALGAALFPRLSLLFVEDGGQARRLVKRAAAFSALAMLGLVGAALAAYRPVLGRWMGGAFAARSFPIALALGFGSVVNGVANVLFTAVQARGGARPTAILHLLELTAYVPVLMVMVRRYGLTGAAWTWVFRVVLDALLLAFIYGVRAPAAVQEVRP